MAIILNIYKFFLKFVYLFMKLFSKKEKMILFLSRQDNKLSIDFEYIIDEINKKYPEYKIVTLTKRMEKNNIKQIISYFFHPFVQMYYLSKAEICIIDGYQITVSVLNHKNLKVIQIWHSLVAIKKFGYQTLKTNKDKKIANIMCMHKNYDAIVSGSKYMNKYFGEAFNYPEDKFINFGLPRVDYLINTKKQNEKKVYKAYPELKNKKVILYVPTFRINNNYKVDELINNFKNLDYELIIKLHPRTKINVPNKYIYSNISSLEALSVADYVITDYSGISVEASILDKNVLLFDYDKIDYMKSEGINVDLSEDLKDYYFEDIYSLVKFIENGKYDKKILRSFRNKYVEVCDGTSTEKLVKYILEV